ncbi:hypothetical protein QTP86_017136 [Hemibagrus guttatus]|nr:hypothetical protein QTP86_017136 [Hemibagrus guttatus]
MQLCFPRYYLVYKLEAQQSLNKEKQDASSRFNSIYSQHQMLKNQHEELKKQFYELQEQHHAQGEDHNKVVDEHQQRYDRLQQTKETEISKLKGLSTSVCNVMSISPVESIYNLREENRQLRKAHQEIHVQLQDTREEFVRNVLEVKRVSDRVMSLKLEFEGVMLNVVSGYAPQVGCELEEKERFWSELDEVMESIPTGERVVIGADFNGHVGEGNTGDEEVMGKFGVKERNLEGQMVVDFAKRMDMGVVNTYFQKREEHRVTYKSGGRRTQVDYILCRRGNLKEISDCKVVVGESVARQHRMVVCRMTLMVSKKKWDMDRTEENRQEYKELQRRVKREESKAKQKAYEELYTRLDTREGEKDLYRLARQRDRDGKDVQQVRVIKDRDGRVLTSEESVQRRWKEYFEELMNEENEREKRVEGVNSVEQKVDKIRKDEVRKALKRMKSGKAVGPDDTGDLEKAYDRVPREELWYCMRKSGVAEKYVRVVQDMYERSRTVVRCAVGQTEEFNVEVGLHQGSALSPFLFAIVMDQLSEEVRQESPWTMMFADDIVICSESREQVEENLERWRFALERRGMKQQHKDLKAAHDQLALTLEDHKSALAVAQVQVDEYKQLKETLNKMPSLKKPEELQPAAAQSKQAEQHQNIEQRQKRDERKVEEVQEKETRHEGLDQPHSTEQRDGLPHEEEEEEEKEPEQNLPDENALERESHISQPVSSTQGNHIKSAYEQQQEEQRHLAARLEEEQRQLLQRQEELQREREERERMEREKEEKKRLQKEREENERLEREREERERMEREKEERRQREEQQNRQLHEQQRQEEQLRKKSLYENVDPEVAHPNEQNNVHHEELQGQNEDTHVHREEQTMEADIDPADDPNNQGEDEFEEAEQQVHEEEEEEGPVPPGHPDIHLIKGNQQQAPADEHLVMAGNPDQQEDNLEEQYQEEGEDEAQEDLAVEQKQEEREEEADPYNEENGEQDDAREQEDTGPEKHPAKEPNEDENYEEEEEEPEEDAHQRAEM